MSAVADPAPEYVSIHAPLARSNTKPVAQVELYNVSIHAPLARSNCRKCPKVAGLPSFNTCSSCEEQLTWRITQNGQRGFNTCSSCEEQHLHPEMEFYANRFNTCSSCEEQLDRSALARLLAYVSIHAPLARSNATAPGATAASVFQYMLLLRGATWRGWGKRRTKSVSIHAPLARSNLS